MDESFNPADYGYLPSRVSQYGNNGWIVVHDELPPLVIENGDGWYCILPNVYDADWMPIARAVFG